MIYLSRKKRLLAISETEKLKESNICRYRLIVIVADFLRIKLRSKYINTIEVYYADKSKKTFDVYYWMAFREGIIKNLYLKRLCQIKFITSSEPPEDVSNKKKASKKGVNLAHKIIRKSLLKNYNQLYKETSLLKRDSNEYEKNIEKLKNLKAKIARFDQNGK